MADKPVRAVTTGVVQRVEHLTPHMVRVVVGGDGLRGLTAGTYTDQYVKVQFPRPGVTYPEPFDPAAVRATRPREEWPVVRTYTIRRWLPDLPELWIDFVVHGDEGVAGPWAARARPGDPIFFVGPGGAYTPSPDAGWHLLAGDESAVPAISTAMEAMPPDAMVTALIEVAGPADEVKLETPAAAEIVWLHRGDRPIGEMLVAAVRERDFPDGPVHAFVHGEATFVKELRGHLRLDRGIPMDQLSISGYWRRGMNEDGWQSSKREWNREVDAEQEGPAPSGS
jgi:NADPH-dependent ferric siderophore reductase